MNRRETPKWPSRRPQRSAAVTAAELIDAACRVDYALLARIKWMTRSADFNVKILTEGRTGLKLVAAAAVDRQRGVIGVDFRLHGVFLKRMRPN